jgi:hypothetical protein
MRNSQRYRQNADACLQAADSADGSHYRRLNLLMAQAWLKLAGQDEMIDRLFAEWEIEEPQRVEAVVVPFPSSVRGRQAA